MRVINKELLEELASKTESVVSLVTPYHPAADDLINFVVFQGIQYYRHNSTFCAIYELKQSWNSKDTFFLPVILNSECELVSVTEEAIPRFVNWVDSYFDKK